MPFCVVIAVVVGATTVGLLFPMLGELDEPDEAFVTATVEPETVTLKDGNETVTITVETTDGEPVRGASLVLSDGSLPLADGPHQIEVGPDSNEVSIDIGHIDSAAVPVRFREGQHRGTVQVGIRPPPDSEAAVVDEPEITVVDPG